MTDPVAADVAAVARIDAIPTILEVICRSTGMGFSAVARVTDDRWIACAVRDEIAFGLRPGGELKLETTICNEIRQHHELVAIDHVAEDDKYREHPTPIMYGFQSYISVPIFRSDGRLFGTLCAIDPRPARVKNVETVGMFKLFGELIAFHLDAVDELALGERALSDARRTGELREQFIAVLGHDLRTPLASIGAGASLLGAMSSDARAPSVAAIIQNSVGRMAELIGNILDFARGRLGGGLTVARAANTDVKAIVEQVIAEIRAAAPDRRIIADVAINREVDCDAQRIAQLFANLLSNAVTHGDPAAEINVSTRTDDTAFELAVVNRCEPIPPDALSQLFLPFSRASVRPDREGLGLGLYIASEIARAHGGTIAVTSSAAETRFTFRLPLQRA